MKKGDDIFIVIAYRWGENENHSYTLGAFRRLDEARKCANSHTEYRGGKYACVVEKCKLSIFNDDSDNYIEEVFRTESTMCKQIQQSKSKDNE